MVLLALGIIQTHLIQHSCTLSKSKKIANLLEKRVKNGISFVYQTKMIYLCKGLSDIR